MPNLYDSLFCASEHENHCNHEDISMEIVNQLHGHMDFESVSNYYDLILYNKLLEEHETKKLNIIHFNSRSLPKNYDNILSFLNSLNTPPDILTFTETWLSDNNKHLYKFKGYHSYHIIRKSRRQGGVSIFVSDLLYSQDFKELTIINENIEMLTVKIVTNSFSFLICTVYRPNPKHIAVDEFTHILNELLGDISTRNKMVLIGDFNINLLEHTSHIPTNNFLTNIQTLSFTPLIARPTRFPDSSDLGEPSLLDHIYINFNLSITSGIIHFPITDHLPIFVNISIPSECQKLHKREFRIITDEYKQLFKCKLNSISWQDFLSSRDININCDAFITKLQELYHESFPLKTKYISEKRLLNPWISQAVLNSIKFKNKLYKDYKIGAVTESYYKRYRNSLNKVIKSAKNSHYMNIFTNFKITTKKLWDTINHLKCHNNKNNINYISIDNKTLTNPNEINEAFNKYYVNIAPKLDQKIPPSNIDPVSFLKGNFPSSMSVLPIAPQDVVNIINQLKNKSNKNEIPTTLIKDNKHQLAIPISILFNQSITQGKFPQCFKHAKVIPIYKKGPKHEISNYRPISLLNTFSKIFEKLMKCKLNNFLHSKSVITSDQFGFRQGVNTFTALSTFSEKIYEALDQKKSFLSIFIDFQKAFDTVRHDILLQKLHYYGIRGVIHDWFTDYLSNRTQSTNILDHYSTPRKICYGIPQGSVLGPILFLIYINDLPHVFKNFQTILFADDSTLYLSGNDPTALIYEANAELDNFYKWCVSNRLTVNENKTYFMLFTNKPKTTLPPLFYNFSIVKNTSQHTLLGITFDDSLTFKPHITNISLKLSRIVSLLYKIKDLMPLHVLKIIYNAHILPILSYCMPIWCNTYPTHLLPLFRLQKKIIRIITNSDFLEHSLPLFKETNILTLFALNKLHIGTYMYKSQLDYNVVLLPQHNYPTRTRLTLNVPPHTLTIYQHSLSYTGPKLWNSIPEQIKQKPSLPSFKKHLKNYLQTLY